MLWKKLGSMKKLTKKMKDMKSNAANHEPTPYECLLSDNEGSGDALSPTTTKTPTGYFAVYVGEDRQRFVLPTSYLSHPLFKIMLEKAYNEFGFEQKSGLVVPCSVYAFQEVVSAVECCNGQFDFGDLVQEFL